MYINHDINIASIMIHILHNSTASLLGKRRRERKNERQRSVLLPLTVKQLKQLVVQRLRRMQEEEVQAAKKDPPLQVARDSSFLDAPFTTMVPTPSRREVKRIKKGKYAHFETSLSHRRSRFLTPRREAKKGKHRRQVSDLGSWLEAWHIFVAIRVQIGTQPLELVNYQSIIYQLFSVYSVAASLKYDKHFRQAEAKNKQQTLRLDAVKTCWFGVSRIFHFGPDNNPLCQPTDWDFNWSICNTLRSYKWQSSPC